MTLNIKNPTAEQLARRLAEATGESLTAAVIAALQSRLAAIEQQRAHPNLLAEIAELQAFVRAQPNRDTRTPDEILGYDDHGLLA